jgi:hypothetical protein
MPYSDWLNITDGTEQGDRFSSALEAGYFNADELTFPDLLAMGAKLAAKLNFYNLRNEKDGSWRELFSNDETAIMAMILSQDLKRLEMEFLRYYAMSRDNLILARYLVNFAGMIDFWFRTLAAIESVPARTLSWRIAAVVEQKLAADLHALGVCCRLLRRGDASQDATLFARFHEIWQIGKDQGGPVFAKSRISELHGTEQVKRFLHATFYAFHNAVSYLKKVAAQHLDETFSSRTHSPAIALFMTFLMLYRKAQEKINSFQQRHLDFYYRQMLHLAFRPAAVDATYLIFDADTGSGDIFVAAGTEFPAGKDENNNEILFQADHDLVVTGVRVQALRTLFFKRDRLISPERELNYVTRVVTNHIPAPAKGGETAAVAWPLFGEARKDAAQVPGAGADLGFALATPVLLLREGWRTLEITVCFTSQSTEKSLVSHAVAKLCAGDTSEESFFAVFGAIFSRYLLASCEVLSTGDKAALLEKAHQCLSAGSRAVIDNLLRQDRQDLFCTLLPKIFSVDLTGEQGWHQVSGVVVKRVSAVGRKILDGVKFSFTLGPDVAPIVPFAAELHGEGYETRLPVIRFRINELADFFPYSLFDCIAVKEFQVEVSVKGVTRLLAYNNHGRLDPTKPFAPFGPLPTGNSYLVVGNYEAAVKDLTTLSLNVEWGDLPKNQDGFQEYYQGYETGYSNDSFIAELSVMRDGNWLPESGSGSGGRVTLFDTAANGDAVSPHKVLPVTALAYFKPIEPSLPEEQFRYDLRIRGGFFKLALTGPDSAFGHKEYPALLTSVLTANARKKPKLQQPVPNAPYTPLINRITLDYGASTVIKAGIDAAAARNKYAEKPFHIHPFGLETIRAHGNKRFHHLIPSYQFDGNLFIGFSANRPGGVLTLFFHLREDSSRATAADSPEIAWFYLASNQWQRLSAAQILGDTTDAFLSSGIVTLDIPATIDKRNSIMPNDLYWLKLSAAKDLDSFCSVYGVSAQALQVSRCTGGSEREVAAHTIPAGTIRAPLRTIPGVARVSQPVDTFGGRRQEDLAQLKMRAGERLRHKNRAVLPWDYERLVLERFPEVFKVKCFSTMSSKEERPRPGSVLLVVVPRKKECSDALGFDPMLNAVELNHIRAFVRRHASPFVTVEVRNPVYEQIQVRCSVVLTKQAEVRRGYYLAKLNQAVVDYISPWCEIGYKVRFGWCIRRTDIESYIRNLEYVEFVTRFSMLHISEERSGNYTLGDTARLASGVLPDEEGETVDEIRPHYPWSLAIPVREHHIETGSSLRSVAAKATGIDQLKVGQTFIIGA